MMIESMNECFRMIKTSKLIKFI